MSKKVITESVVKVYETKDYSQFNTMKCNRALDKNLIRNLKESIEKNDLLPYNPILVNEKMEVIDGQHRLEVCKDTNHTVYFIIKKGSNEDCVRDLNVNKKNWNNENYFNFYVNKGDETYLELKAFLEETQLPLIAGMTLFSNGKTSTQQFRRGDLEMDNTNWKTVLDLLNATRFANSNFNLYLIKGLLKYISSKKRAFTEKRFNTMVERLEFAVGMRWGEEKRYVDLLEGKIAMK